MADENGNEINVGKHDVRNMGYKTARLARSDEENEESDNAATEQGDAASSSV